MIDITIRFPQLTGNPNKGTIINILDTDLQISNRKAGIDLEGGDDFDEIREEGPDDYASYLLEVIESSNDPDVDEDDYLGQVTYDGDSREKQQRLVDLYHRIKPLL